MKNPVGAIALGRRLKALREKKGLSKQELADVTHIGLATLKRIENASNSPSLDYLITISRALGVHLYELVMDDAITDGDRDSLPR